MKYLVHASLLLLFLLFIIFAITTFSSTEFISSNHKPTTDFIDPASESVSINAEGKSLFSSNCQTCHALDKVLTGPALRGVENRGPWTDRKNLIKWVKNPAATINQFTYTKNLVKEFGQVMPSFQQLTDKQIEAVFNYIKQVPMYTNTPTALR